MAHTRDSQLISCLKSLHLPTIRACYQEQADMARQEAWSYEQYLLEVVEREQETRWQKRIARFLRESKLPQDKTFDTFERSRLPRTVDAQISALLDGAFLARCDNVLAFGNPGSGKTHLLCALSHALVQQGHRVRVWPCALLVQELLIAKRELTLPRMLKQLAKYEALLIDDLGYVQQNREEMEVLFTLLAERYERGSVLLTSNLPFSQWERIFKDPMTTAAAIDRLVHHSVILELNIASYRLHQSSKGQEGEAAEPPCDDTVSRRVDSPPASTLPAAAAAQQAGESPDAEADSDRAADQAHHEAGAGGNQTPSPGESASVSSDR
jgi:DNA replication protein DnaC